MSSVQKMQTWFCRGGKSPLPAGRQARGKTQSPSPVALRAPKLASHPAMNVSQRVLWKRKKRGHNPIVWLRYATIIEEKRVN